VCNSCHVLFGLWSCSIRKYSSSLCFIHQQYAANLWVWNTPRDGYPGNPRNPNYKPDSKKEEVKVESKGGVEATFRNYGKDKRLINAKLYFYDGKQDNEWGSLGFGENLSVRTYKSHVWKVMVDGEALRTFTIDKEDPPLQEFIF
jgi:hypothetical protein